MKQMIFFQFICLFCIISTHVHADYGFSGKQLDGQPCKGRGQGHGPFDYFEVMRVKNSPLWVEARLWEVNKIHFGKGQREWREDGITRISIKRIAGEFAYTLKSFPNHPDALYAVIKLELDRLQLNRQKKRDVFSKLMTPPECYLIRAIKYRPKQAHIYLLYAIYLHKLEVFPSAQKYYKKALKIDSKDGEAHYNYGLLLYKLKDYKSAVEHAKKAIKYKYPMTGLKNKLTREGHWKK